jgi:glycosyltransferase involved in cell wall biosynthesis
MNILFETISYHPMKGGAELMIERLAIEFMRLGHNVTVVTQRYPDSLPEFERRNGIDIIRLKYPPDNVTNRKRIIPFIRISWPVTLAIKKIISARNIDVVCVGLLGTGSISAVLLKYVMRFKFVLYLHGGEIRKDRHVSKLKKLILTLCLRKARVVIAVSNRLKEEAVKFAPFAGKKMHFLPNGVDFKKIRACPGHSHPRDYILYVGRFHPVKGTDILINAFHSISSQVPGLDLFMIGVEYEDRGVEKGLRQMVSEYGLENRAFFLGSKEQEEVYSLLNSCKFMVMPSHAEGCPLVLLEALAANKAVIGSNVKGIAEIIENGKNGILFPEGDSKELGRLIVEYYTDKQKLNSIEENIKRACFEDKYDIASIAAKHLSLYAR